MLLGPLFPFELTRLARRGLQPRLRTIFVAFLLAGLAHLYIGLIPDSMPYDEILASTPALARNALAKFGEKFMLLYLTVQLIAVILFTPVYAAGSVIEEKNRKTLEFLQSSPLSGREIILGKFFARLAFVLSIILAGLPVLMLTSFFGGVDPARLLYGFTIAIVAAIFLGSYAMMEAMKSETLGRVLFRSYLLLVGFMVLSFSCLMGGTIEYSAISIPSAFANTVLYQGSSKYDPWEIVVIFTGLHLLASAVFLSSAIRSVRSELSRSPEPEPRDAKNVAPTITQIANADPLFNKAVFTELNLNAPPIGDSDNPIIWKETHFSSRVVRKGTGVEALLMMAMVIAIYPIALYLLVSLVKDINDGVWIGRTVNGAVRVFLEVVLFGAPIVVGFRAATCIGTERQKETLLSLLTIPWERRTILGAKWWAAIHSIRVPLRSAAGVLIAGTLLLGVHPMGAIATAVEFCGFLSFCASAGILFTVYRSSVMRATMAFMLVWLLAMFGGFMATYFVSPYQRTNGDFPFTWLALPLGLWNFLFGWKELDDEYALRSIAFDFKLDSEITVSMLGLLIGFGYFVLSRLCWRAAVKRFEREGKDRG